jgi:hypothetical protein
MTTFDQCLGAWFSGTLLEVMRACEDAMGSPQFAVGRAGIAIRPDRNYAMGWLCDRTL